MGNGTTNHDQELLLDSLRDEEVVIESRINALKASLQGLSTRNKNLLDTLNPLPDEEAASAEIIQAVSNLQSDVTALNALVPEAP